MQERLDVLARAVIGRLARPKTLLWGAVVAISGAIVGNALFLQPSPHPSPLFVTRSSARPAPPATPDELVRALQLELSEAGYYGGPADGFAGSRTGAAIVAFERITGREVTGKVSPEVLEAIRAATPAEQNQGDAAITGSVAPAHPDARVAKVQNALSRAAYGQIRADGVFGPQTRDAIKQFQADHGLPVTGAIDDALLMELATAGALEGE